MKSDLQDIEVQYQTETDRAFCVRIVDGEDVWLPKAACEVEGQLHRGGTVTLTASARLLTEKGLV